MNDQTQSIRKQVYELSSDDLENHPLWDFCADEEDKEGQDEATVRPSKVAVEGFCPGKFFSLGMYIVAADVTFGDGTNGIGYIYSGKPNDFGCLQPNVIVGSSQVNFWLGSMRFSNGSRGQSSGTLREIGQAFGSSVSS